MQPASQVVKLLQRYEARLILVYDIKREPDDLVLPKQAEGRHNAHELAEAKELSIAVQIHLPPRTIHLVSPMGEVTHLVSRWRYENK